MDGRLRRFILVLSPYSCSVQRKANGVAECVVPGVWCETSYGFRFRSAVRERLIDVEKGTLKSGVRVNNREDAVCIVQCC